MRESFTKALILILLTGNLLSGCSDGEKEEFTRPNILLILADDLGYSDLGCYGGEIQTPNLDELAEEGVLCSRFYVSPMCVTTRMALFSGMEYMAAGGPSLPNGYSFVHLLRDAGYATSMVGKNHGLGNFLIGSPETDYGFDHFFGFSGGELNSFTGEGNVEWQSDGRIYPYTELPEGFYTTENFTDSAMKFMREAIDERKPFFSYVAFNAPHTPLHAPEKNVKKYYDPANGINAYEKGWDLMREERFERMKKLGLLSAEDALPELGVEIPRWDLLPDTAYTQWELQKEFECLTRAAYAGMVDNIDENVGELIAFLNDPDGDGNTKDSQLDNTLVIFASDNGGCYAGLRGRREDVPWDPATRAFTTNFGWGALSNTPYRYYKHASHEGALRSPLIMHWPEGISLPEGSQLDQMLTIWDLYPTFLDLAGSAYPAEVAGSKPKPLMGKSFSPLFIEQDNDTEDYFVSIYNRSRSLIKGKWKIVIYHDGPFELYNLETDPAETKDLAEDEPEILAGLVLELDEYAKLHGFENDPRYNRPPGTVKRGWGFDWRWKENTSTMPEYMSDNVPLDVGFELEFVGEVDFSGTQGRKVHLQKYGTPGILWSVDPDVSHPGQGTSKVIFEDFPTLEPNSHYNITWDAGWVKVKSGGEFIDLRAVKEGPWAFRFKTIAN